MLATVLEPSALLCLKLDLTSADSRVSAKRGAERGDRAVEVAASELQHEAPGRR